MANEVSIFCKRCGRYRPGGNSLDECKCTDGFQEKLVVPCSKCGKDVCECPVDAEIISWSCVICGTLRPAAEISSNQKCLDVAACDRARCTNEMRETVDHPSHYGGDTTYECIKVLEAWGLDKSFCLGNAVKYICRAERKGSTLEDLKKAAFYLNREIANRSKT